MIEEFKKLAGREIKRKSLDMKEAVVTGVGSSASKYNLTLRSGHLLKEVVGALGYSVGDNVLVCYMAKSNNFVIVARTPKSATTIKTVVV